MASEREKNGKNGSLEQIVCSVLFGVGDVKVRAAKEIRKMTKTSAKIRAYLASAGVIVPLVSMLKSSNLDAKEAALLALLNLAVKDERNKIRIVKAGAVDTLVELLKSENAKLRECAGAAILTLSASSVNKPIIGSSGATPLLVEMLTSGSLQAKVDALVALNNLATHPDNLPTILASGAVAPLIILLKDCKKSSKVAEKLTSLLEYLSAYEEGRINITEEEGGILTLVEVLEDGSPEGREHAVEALLTICHGSRGKYREAILKEGAIPGLLELTIQGTPNAQCKARTLLQLLRDSQSLTQTCFSSTVLESIVDDISAHVDGVEEGTQTAKKMLTEMVRVSMDRSTRHLQQKAPACVPSENY